MLRIVQHPHAGTCLPERVDEGRHGAIALAFQHEILARWIVDGGGDMELPVLGRRPGSRERPVALIQVRN